jgi:competence protein ComEC
LRVAVQKPAAIAALMASFVYLVISGASVSTQRAFIMSAVVFGAVLADRAALSLRSYAIAMILVVLLQPESVMTPGFQMSFAASGALIATYDAWTRHRSSQERVLGPASYTWVSLFMTSLVAGTATAPFAIYHFDRLAGFGLLANLLAMPVITFISAPLAALSLILTPVGLGDMGLRMFGYSLEVVLAIANWCANLLAAAVTLPRAMPAETLVLSSAAIALAMAARGGARIMLALLVLVPAGAMWFRAPEVIAHWAPSGDLFLREQSGELTRYELEDGDGLAPLRYSNAPAGEACSSSPCDIPLRTGKASIRMTPDGSTTVQVTDELDTITLTWPDTARAGGITVMSGRSGLYEVAAPACGNRLWRACDQS